MRSFEVNSLFATNEVDVSIPQEKIPTIITHWYAVYYYGSKDGVLGLRKYLEKKLKSATNKKSVVETWLRNAESWHAGYPAQSEILLTEYHQIHLVD